MALWWGGHEPLGSQTCDFRFITPVLLLQNYVELGLVAARGQHDGGCQNETSAKPGIGAEVFAQEPDAEIGAEGRLDIEEDTGTRGGDVVDAPVPQKGRGCRAGQAANRQCNPCGMADMSE